MNSILSEKDIQAVNAILVRELDVRPDQVTPEAGITHDLRADSLNMIEIGMAIEEHYDLTIPDGEWDKVSTVSDLYGALANLLLQVQQHK